MGVHFVPRAWGEVDDAQVEILARFGCQQRLARHGTTGEQGGVDRLSRDLVGLVHLHGAFSFTLIATIYTRPTFRATGHGVNAASSLDLPRRGGRAGCSTLKAVCRPHR